MTINVDDPLISIPTLPPPAEVLSEETEGRQRRMIVRGFSPAMRHELSSHRGINGVKDRSASLEELFVACTRGIGAMSQPRDQGVTSNGTTKIADGVTP